MTNYAWRRGSRALGDVQQIGAELEAIHNEKGKLTPGEVVKRARRKSSPLHGCFEWDNNKAAEEHRKQQARTLIRSVRIIRPRKKRDEPAFVSVRYDGECSYMSARVVVKKPDLWNSVIEQAVKDLRAMQGRLEDLKSLETGTRKRSIGPLCNAVTNAQLRAERLMNK